MAERSVEDYLVARSKRRGVWAVKCAVPGLNGFPDRMLLAPGGRAAFAELKRRGKVARKLQQWVHKRLRALGFKVETIDRHDQIDPFLDDWLGPEDA